MRNVYPFQVPATGITKSERGGSPRDHFCDFTSGERTEAHDSAESTVGGDQTSQANPALVRPEVQFETTDRGCDVPSNATDWEL